MTISVTVFLSEDQAKRMSAVHSEHNSNPSRPHLGIASEAFMEGKKKIKLFNFKNPSNCVEIQRFKEFLENATDSYLPVSMVGIWQPQTGGQESCMTLLSQLDFGSACPSIGARSPSGNRLRAPGRCELTCSPAAGLCVPPQCSWLGIYPR